MGKSNQDYNKNKVLNIFTKVVNSTIDFLEYITIQYMLWVYINLIHIFGVFGLFFTVVCILLVFVGDFLLAYLLLSVALGSLWLDLIVKDNN